MEKGTMHVEVQLFTKWSNKIIVTELASCRIIKIDPYGIPTYYVCTYIVQYFKLILGD